MNTSQNEVNCFVQVFKDKTESNEANEGETLNEDVTRTVVPEREHPT